MPAGNDSQSLAFATTRSYHCHRQLLGRAGRPWDLGRPCCRCRWRRPPAAAGGIAASGIAGVAASVRLRHHRAGGIGDGFGDGFGAGFGDGFGAGGMGGQGRDGG